MAKHFDINVAKKYGTTRITHVAPDTFPNSKCIVSVVLHSTEIVRLDRRNNIVTLNSGGWRTVTTKADINTALRQIPAYDGWFLASKKGEWFLEHSATGKRVDFYDGITLGGGAGLPVQVISNRKAG